MAESKNSKFFFMKIRQLPRGEYRLMKGLIKKYDLDDEREIIVLILRFLHVNLTDLGQEKIWRQMISEWRGNQSEDRTYEL